MVSLLKYNNSEYDAVAEKSVALAFFVVTKVIKLKPDNQFEVTSISTELKLNRTEEDEAREI